MTEEKDGNKERPDTGSDRTIDSDKARTRRDAGTPNARPGKWKQWLSPVVFLLLGGLVGYSISDYFHNISGEERRQILIDNVLMEIDINTTHPIFEMYSDTAKHSASGRPFKQLETASLQELYKDFSLFGGLDSTTRATFLETILNSKFSVEHFNERVRLRTVLFLKIPFEVKDFNPGIFAFYYKTVLPSYDRLAQYLSNNRDALIAGAK